MSARSSTIPMFRRRAMSRESLTALLTRVHCDCLAVSAPCSWQILAAAAVTSGWRPAPGGRGRPDTTTAPRLTAVLKRAYATVSTPGEGAPFPTDAYSWAAVAQQVEDNGWACTDARYTNHQPVAGSRATTSGVTSSAARDAASERTEKQCAACGLTKPLTEFGTRGGDRAGHPQGACRACSTRTERRRRALAKAAQ